MLPLKDSNPKKRRPWVNVFIIVTNLVVFVYQLLLGEEVVVFFQRYGVIPIEYTKGIDIGIPSFIPLNLLTCMFIHGGFLHIIGNMLYLWIFGDNVEDSMGHFRYLIFYLLSGLFATLLQILITPFSEVPMIGASGAISGVLGAYLVLFPRAKVYTLIPNPFLFGLFYSIIQIPAFLFLIFWFLYQLFFGVIYIPHQGGGGVAWWAHIGGFVYGLIVVRYFAKRRSYYYY